MSFNSDKSIKYFHDSGRRNTKHSSNGSISSIIRDDSHSLDNLEGTPPNNLERASKHRII